MSEVFVVVHWKGEHGLARDLEAPMHSRETGGCVYLHRENIVTKTDRQLIKLGTTVTGRRERDWNGRLDRLIDVEIVEPPEPDFERQMIAEGVKR